MDNTCRLNTCTCGGRRRMQGNDPRSVVNGSFPHICSHIWSRAHSRGRRPQSGLKDVGCCVANGSFDLRLNLGRGGRYSEFLVPAAEIGRMLGGTRVHTLQAKKISRPPSNAPLSLPKTRIVLQLFHGNMAQC